MTREESNCGGNHWLYDDLGDYLLEEKDVDVDELLGGIYYMTDITSIIVSCDCHKMTTAENIITDNS